MQVTCQCGRSYTFENDPGHIVCHCGLEPQLVLNDRVRPSVMREAKSWKNVAVVGKGPIAAFTPPGYDAYYCINDAIYLKHIPEPRVLVKSDQGSHCTRGLPPCTQVIAQWAAKHHRGAFVFEWADLKLPRRMCTICCALPLADMWGAETIHMYGFDRLFNPAWGEYLIANKRNLAPLGDQKPQFREIRPDIIEKCHVMDRMKRFIPLKDILT